MTDPALLSPDALTDDRAPLLRDAAERAIRYLDGLDARPVAATDAARQRLAGLDTPLPDGPIDPDVVLDLLDTLGSPATTATAGGRYFGFVTGGTLPAALAANWLAGAWDQNSGLSVMSPVGSAIEEIARRWLLEALQLPPDSAAGFVTGGTMANFTALAAARHAVLQRVGWDVEADGLFGAPPVAVIVGEEVHVSALKALSLLGFGRDRVTRVAVDGQGRMRANAMPEVSGPDHHSHAGRECEHRRS
jgi:glutamate/tyrosine decarboxylase-like PLP-dependent enzyme